MLYLVVINITLIVLHKADVLEYHLHTVLFEGYVSKIELPHGKTNNLHRRKQKVQINCEADQRLCFCYSDSTIPFLLNIKILSVWLSSVTVQVGLCQTWSETQIVGFSHAQAQSFFNYHH